MRCGIRSTEDLGVNWTEVYKPERRASWEDIAEAIRDTVTMEDVIAAYTPEYLTHRSHGRIPCPIHHGKDLNFSYKDKGYMCFVCNEHGDVIKFVQTVCSCRDRTDAMKLINRDLHLNLPLDREISVTENTALEDRRRTAREREAKRAAWEEGYHRLWDEWCRLDRQKRECEPGTEPWIEAVKNIDRVAWDIDCYPNEPG